ncbi:MAG: TldD/PmbA family protein [Ruminococcaceae bacterium]|nr:TldD/PmbA family protein [Oscillospiraceae bacterium]
MGFSKFLSSRIEALKELVGILGRDFEYVSILGADTKSLSIRADKSSSSISEGNDYDSGFVVKLSRNGIFYEYSMDDIDPCIPALAERISSSFPAEAFEGIPAISRQALSDEPLEKNFLRESDIDSVSEEDMLNFCRSLSAELLACSDKLLNAFTALSYIDTHKLFISKNRTLTQHYTWCNGVIMGVYKDNDKMVQPREIAYGPDMGGVMAQLPLLKDALIKKGDILSRAKPIEPGVYDVITDPSITGLIAHEAFGHGVEMDQFVKDRALAKEFVGKYVASPICNMRDGAASTLSAASYFFDDDGVLAGDTQIIKDGILVTGISDLSSATQLGTAPTGNGRRESIRRKAYARMTNTIFEPGKDKLEDMIASIDHGYMLFETDNGMEDPKNWAIQCVAEYGIEIIEGKLTENYVSPVVMSGYVPDLLGSISMVSDDFRVIGAGACGKGYKEWVRVSDGGSALKVKVKLG